LLATIVPGFKAFGTIASENFVIGTAVVTTGFGVVTAGVVVTAGAVVVTAVVVTAGDVSVWVIKGKFAYSSFSNEYLEVVIIPKLSISDIFVSLDFSKESLLPEVNFSVFA